MKNTPVKKFIRLALAIATFAGAAGIVIAGEAATDKNAVAQVITLRAPNSAAQTVTIWKSRTISRSDAETTTVKNGTAKVIELHAPNGPTQSVTVWTGGTENKLEVAPLK